MDLDRKIIKIEGMEKIIKLKSRSLKWAISIKISFNKNLMLIKKFLTSQKYLQKFGRLSFGQSRGDVPGWVLVVLMTTALVTGIWSIAAPKLTTILRNSLDAMAGIK